MQLGDAVAKLKELVSDPENHNTFDFCFVDADKVNYPIYYELIYVLLRKGGWIAFDNSFAGNGVLAKGKDIYNLSFSPEQIEAIHELN